MQGTTFAFPPFWVCCCMVQRCAWNLKTWKYTLCRICFMYWTLSTSCFSQHWDWNLAVWLGGGSTASLWNDTFWRYSYLTIFNMQSTEWPQHRSFGPVLWDLIYRITCVILKMCTLFWMSPVFRLVKFMPMTYTNISSKVHVSVFWYLRVWYTRL